MPCTSGYAVLPYHCTCSNSVQLPERGRIRAGRRGFGVGGDSFETYPEVTAILML